MQSVERQALMKVLLYTMVTAAVYFGSAKLVAPLSLSESSSIFAIWPPTGVALFFLFFRGYAVLPGIFLGAFWLNATLSSPAVAFEIAFGNTLGPAVTYALIQSHTAMKNDIFYDTDTVVRFLIYSVTGAFITSSLGTTVLYLNALLLSEHQILGWAVWFFGDLIGFILIVPLLVAYVVQRNNSPISKKHLLEVAFILVMLVLSSMVVFGSGYFFEERYPIEYLILFPLIWASSRLPYGISLLFLVIVVVSAILGTASGYSQFSIEGNHRLSLIFLQVFIFTVTFAILMMTAQRSETMRVLREKEFLSLMDPLTQIGNRRLFTLVLGKEIEINRRYSRPVSIILFDIDRFKLINDTLGHQCGDRVLQELASLVKGHLRASDHISRWGGEEFVIVQPECVLEDAVQTAEKLRRIIEEHPFSIGQQVTCSFGVVQCGEGESVDGVMRNVDTCLYEAKETGRNKVVSHNG